MGSGAAIRVAQDGSPQSLTAPAVSADSDIARLSADAVQIGYRKEIGALRVFGNKEVSSTAMDADAVP